MAWFRVYLDGRELGWYECSGKYDVANELFGKVHGIDEGSKLVKRFAEVAVYQDDAEGFGVVLLDEGNKRLLAVHRAEPR